MEINAIGKNIGVAAIMAAGGREQRFVGLPTIIKSEKKAVNMTLQEQVCSPKAFIITTSLTSSPVK